MMLTGTSATLLLASCRQSEIWRGLQRVYVWCGIVCTDFGCLNVEGEGTGTVAEGTIALIL